MAPLTWDHHTPIPKPDPTSAELDTNPTTTFEPADFGESEAERTVITTAKYDFKPKFTGRTASIKQLQDLVDRAFTPNGTLAFAVVIGEPGMGKSRIIGELIARARSAHRDLLVVSGIADENSHAYGPISRALSARFPVSCTAKTRRRAADKILAGVAEVVQAQRVPEIAHLVAHLLRVPSEDSPVVGPLLDSPQRLEARLFMALKRLLTAEADRRPAMIVVENLELCETDTLNFLQYLAAGMRDQRIAIIGTATHALYERHTSFGDGEVAPTKIELGALTPAESEELLRELCKQLHDVPPRLLAHVRGMGGSPRAIQELVRLLHESDVIVREGVMWRLDPEKVAAMTLPKTYEELVAARLRVMEPVERRVVEMASVVGETSWLDAVIALERADTRTSDPDGPTLAEIAASGDHSRISVADAVNKLIEREWLVEMPASSVAGERELRFAYPNLWSLVYKGMDEHKRRAYHGVVARWLELHPEGRTPAVQEEVARHLTLGGDAREAASRYRRAAEAARAAYQNEKAIRLFDRALACIGSHTSSDLGVRLYLWQAIRN